MTKQRQTELKITNQILAILVVVLAIALGIAVGKQKGWVNYKPVVVKPSNISLGQSIALPEINKKDTFTKLLASRVSQRPSTNQPLTLNELADLAWAMQGKTADWGERTVPSPKSAFPLQLRILVKNVSELQNAVYLYDSSNHALQKIEGLSDQILNPYLSNLTSYENTAIAVVITADTEKLAAKYDGNTREDLLYIEAGQAIQNALLAAERNNLSVTQVNTIDATLNAAMGLSEHESIVSILLISQSKQE